MSDASHFPAASFRVRGLDHVQLAMPAGEEGQARAFYGGLLRLREVPKPPNLARRGGVWFESGTLRLHLGVEGGFQPARKAHPALLVESLPSLVQHLRAEGVEVLTDEPLEGFDRVYVADPFGNRIELLEPTPSAHDEVQFAVEEIAGEAARSLMEAMCAELSIRYGTPPSPLERQDAPAPRTAVIIGRRREELVACAALRRLDDDTAEVKRLYVAPAARRCGIARRLLGELEQTARGFGYRAIQLETGLRQPEAIQLYETSGYHRIPPYGFYVGNPLSVCFAKALVGSKFAS